VQPVARWPKVARELTFCGLILNTVACETFLACGISRQFTRTWYPLYPDAVASQASITVFKGYCQSSVGGLRVV